MDKILKRVKKVRNNWSEAFKVSVNIHGYNYYDLPGELRYRYPAPGSCALDKTSHLHLFKNHWKVPFRDSHFNVRAIPLKTTWPDETDHYISEFPSLDPNNEDHAELLKEPQPDVSHLQPLWTNKDLESEEMLALMHTGFEELHKERLTDLHYRTPWNGDYDADYNQEQFNWRERGATGMESDPRMKSIFVELEMWIEDVIGVEQIKNKEVQMYKGTVKKWQVLDDSEHDRDQIEQMQAAVQAPLPEELEMYEEKHSVPMKLPFNNENATAWRDEPLAIDSADFDPEFLAIDRERKQRFFLERYEKPKELTE